MKFIYKVIANLPDHPQVLVWPSNDHHVATLSGDEFNTFRTFCARLGVPLVEASDERKNQYVKRT